MKEIYDPLWEEVGREKYLKNLEKEDSPMIRSRYNQRCIHCSGKGRK